MSPHLQFMASHPKATTSPAMLGLSNRWPRLNRPPAKRRNATTPASFVGNDAISTAVNVSESLGDDATATFRENPATKPLPHRVLLSRGQGAPANSAPDFIQIA